VNDYRYVAVIRRCLSGRRGLSDARTVSPTPLDLTYELNSTALIDYRVIIAVGFLPGDVFRKAIGHCFVWRNADE
jgi:hypothetical protein